MMCSFAITSGIGGENIATTVQGRERYPINVRYLEDYRSDLDALRAVLIMTPSGAQIPLSEIAKVDLSPGPSMIRDEDARLTGYVYIDLSTNDYGGYVTRAQHVLDSELRLPPAWVYAQMVRRVRISTARTKAPLLYHANRIRGHLRPALHAIPFRNRGGCAYLPLPLRNDGWSPSSVPDGL